MVIESSLLCNQRQEAKLEREDTQLTEKTTGCKRFEWSSSRVLDISSYGASSDNDAKTLAARRKRSEIRRLRLAAAALHQDNINEPCQKRRKPSPSFRNNMSKEGDAAAGMATGAATSCRSGLEEGVGVGTLDHISDGGDPAEDQSRSSLRGSDHNSRATCPSHCVVSICGRSWAMEDTAIAVPSFLTLPSSLVTGQRHTETFNFYGVYDGHGGPQAAEFCKERLHGVLADEMSLAGDSLWGQWEACFRSCFRKLDTELCGFCPHAPECPSKLDASSATAGICREPLVPGSVGTTALVAVVGAEHIIVGNCGDCRAVLSRGGQVVPLSFDHKPNHPDELARVEAAGGQVFMWQGHRVCGVLATSRALGDGFLKPFVSGEPEVTVTARNDADECLILASDGLWDALSNEFVCAVARKALANWRNQYSDPQRHKGSQEGCSPHASLDVGNSPAQVVAALLIKLALAKYSKDNISVIVVDLKRL